MIPLDIQAFCDVSIAIVAWAIAIQKFATARQRWTRDWRVFSSWGFIFCLALSVSFQVDPLYVSLDGLTGVANLSWLLSYVSTVAALYLAASCGCAISRVPPPRWMRLCLVVALGLLLAVFWWGICSSPEWTAHDVPRTVYDLVFMETVYVYGVCMGALVLQTFVRLYHAEQNVLTRVHWLAISAAALLGTTFYLVKVILTGLGYLCPASSLLGRLDLLATILMGLTGLMWPLAVLPNRAYRVLVEPFAYVGKMLTLRSLRRVQVEINRLPYPRPPAAVVYDPALWRCLSNLDFHIYRTVIYILDSKKMLAACADGGPLDLPGPPPGPEDVREVVLLYQMLREVPDGEYPELVAACRAIGRKLGRREWQDSWRVAK